MRCVPQLIRFLANLQKATDAFINPTAELRHVLDKVHVRDHDFVSRQPMITVSSAGMVRDYSVERIASKLDQPYESDAPIELLAWVNGAVDKPGWREQLMQMVRKELEGSLFRRVWVFERAGNIILFAHPEKEHWLGHQERR